MASVFVARGAEAVLSRVDGRLVKERVEKKYRLPELDLRLRKFRTQREAKILENAAAIGVAVPRVLEVDLAAKKIVMEFVEGRLLKEVIPELGDKDLVSVARQIGGTLAVLHEANIIHNDLTTSNMILRDGGVVFIDFGLGVTSTRIEDKAVDLVVFKKALQATHADRFELIWRNVLDGYRKYGRSKEVVDRIAVVEKRARYT